MIVEQKALTGIECKLASVDVAGDTMAFEGYGAVFGNVDSYGDVIAPGAFAKSLTEHMKAGTQPLMFLNHDAFGSLPIGRWTSMSEDGYGLKVTGQLLDTTTGRDTYTALKAGAINGLSIGFRPTEFQLRQNPEDPKRLIKAVDLVEVSVVTLPANQKARVSAVKAAMEEMSIRDLEGLLRECGLSRKDAEAVCSQFESKKHLEEQAFKQSQHDAEMKSLMDLLIALKQ